MESANWQQTVGKTDLAAIILVTRQPEVEREAIQLTGNVLAAEVPVAVVGPFGGCRGGRSRGRRGVRYRLTFRNRTDDSHPLHLHRHQFEIAEIYGKATAGIIKDTVVAPSYGRVFMDFTADQPGPALFHCHIQHHMDYGFKALLKYA